MISPLATIASTLVFASFLANSPEDFVRSRAMVTSYVQEANARETMILRVNSRRARIELAIDCRETIQEVRTASGRPAGYDLNYLPEDGGIYLFLEVKGMDEPSIGHQDWRLDENSGRGTLFWYRRIREQEPWIYHIHAVFGSEFSEASAREWIEELFAYLPIED